VSINVASNFRLYAQLPLDYRQVVADTTTRDALSAGERYDGLCIYCESDNTTYQLQGGITNADWKIVIFPDIVIDPTSDDLITTTRVSAGLVAGQLQTVYNTSIENNVADDVNSASIGYTVTATDNYNPELLLNNSFENWDLVYAPDDFDSDDSPVDITSVGRTTDSHSGTYALFLKAETAFLTSFRSIALWNTSATFTTADTIQTRFWAKQSVGTPSAIVVYMYKDAGATTYAYNFTGANIGTWTALMGPPSADQVEVIALTGSYAQYASTIATAPAGVASDSQVRFGFIGSNGDIGFIDDLEVTISSVNTATNGDFELWTSDYVTLQDWDTSFFGAGGGDDPEIRAETTTVYDGTVAVTLESKNGKGSYIEQSITTALYGYFNVWIHDTGAATNVRMAALNGPVASATEEYDSATDTWGAYGGGEPTKYIEGTTAGAWAEIGLGEVTSPVSGIINVVIWNDFGAGDASSIVDLSSFETPLIPKLAGYLVKGDQVAISYGSLNQHLILAAINFDLTGTTEMDGSGITIRAGDAISHGGAVDGGDIELVAGAGAGGGDDGIIEFSSIIEAKESGASIDEFSNDTTMADDSTSALVTEHAAKSYTDTLVGAIPTRYSRISDEFDTTFVETELTPADHIIRLGTGGTEWLHIKTGSTDRVDILGNDAPLIGNNGTKIKLSAGNPAPIYGQGGALWFNVTASTGGAPNDGYFAFMQDDGTILELRKDDANNGTQFLSMFNGTSGSTAYTLNIDNALASGSSALKIVSDYSGTPTDIFGIDYAGQLCLGNWATIETSDYGAFFVASNASPANSSSPAFIFGAKNSIADDYQILSLGHSTDTTPENSLALLARGDLYLGDWGTITTSSNGEMKLSGSSVEGSGVAGIKFGNTAFLGDPVDKLFEFWNGKIDGDLITPPYGYKIGEIGYRGQMVFGAQAISAGATDFPVGWNIFNYTDASPATPFSEEAYFISVANITTMNAHAFLGVGISNDSYVASGVTGWGEVENSADSKIALGLNGYAIATHSGGANVAVRGNATNGKYNYAVLAETGNIYNFGREIYKPSATQTLSTNDAFDITSSYIVVNGNGGAVTGIRPAEVDPVTGEAIEAGTIIYVISTSDTDTVSMSDVGGVLQLKTGSVTLGSNDVCTLLYTGTLWTEI